MGTKLPTKKEIVDRYGQKSIHEIVTTDPEVSKWLNDIFASKRDGEINISFDSIGDELSAFLDRRVNGSQVRWAYVKWLDANR
jgi:hypothetical protein